MDIANEFQDMDNSDKSVDDLSTMFENKLLVCVKKHIPTKMTKGRNHLPICHQGTTVDDEKKGSILQKINRHNCSWPSTEE